MRLHTANAVRDVRLDTLSWLEPDWTKGRFGSVVVSRACDKEVSTWGTHRLMTVLAACVPDNVSRPLFALRTKQREQKESNIAEES